MDNLTPAFYALLEEAKFTREILGSGVTQIGRANYAQKGIYFQAFSSLSIGLERIGKLCVILDYYIRNNGKFPDQKYIKDEIGHDLSKLQSKSLEIIKNNSLSLSCSLKDPLHSEILNILSDFGKGDRYSNINILLSSNSQNDPIKNWNIKVDKVLFEKRVSNKVKEKIELNAKLAEALLGQHVQVLHYSEDRKELDLKDSSYLTGMNKAVAKYRRLYVLQIIRYWVDLLGSLQHKAMSSKNNDIPFFSEIFALFNNEDSYFLTRKTFEKNR